MGKGTSNMLMKGFSSEESEEVFDDEIQSTSEDQASNSNNNRSVVSGKLSQGESGEEEFPKKSFNEVPVLGKQ